MKVVLINDSTTNSNWGDRAAAISLKAMIEARGGEIICAVTEDNLRFSVFSALPHDPDEMVSDRRRETAKLFIPPAARRLRRRILKNVDVTQANRLIPEKMEGFGQAVSRVLAEREHGWPSLLRSIQDADLIVIHGDGAMVGNGIIPRTDLFLAYLAKQCFGKSVILVNHSAYFDHPDLLEMAKGVYPLLDDIVYRDPLSAERCQTLCDGRYAADTAFWFEPSPLDNWLPVARRPTYFDVWPDTADFDPSRPYLCLGGSSLQSTAWRPASLVEDYAALVAHLGSVYDGQIVLTVSGLQELEVFRPLAAGLNLPMISPTTPVQQAVDVLGNSDAYVGGRWHSAIFALRGGAPVIPLSAKQSKMTSLMLAASLPHRTFDALDLARNGEDVAEALSQILSGGSTIRSSLRDWGDRMAQDTWENVSYLDSFHRRME